VLQGFAGHHPAAATEIQPAASIEARPEDIHHRFANTGRGGPCVMAWGAQQAAATGEAELGWSLQWTGSAPWCNQWSQRLSIASPAEDDFSG
jgi:hypothetical protein